MPVHQNWSLRRIGSRPVMQCDISVQLPWGTAGQCPIKAYRAEQGWYTRSCGCSGGAVSFRLGDGMWYREVDKDVSTCSIPSNTSIFLRFLSDHMALHCSWPPVVRYLHLAKYHSFSCTPLSMTAW